MNMMHVSQLYKKNIRFYLLLTLIALELLMSFSFLGYIHIEPISITLAYIPVLLAGALAGPQESVIVAAVFGLSSMWKAGAHYVLPLDQLFSPFMSGHPIESILLSVGSRMLFGLLIGLLYMAARQMRYTGLWICVISFFGRFLHSVLVYSFMGLLFPESGYHAGSALQGFVSVDNLAADAVTTLLVFLLWRVEKSGHWQEFLRKLEKARSLPGAEHYHRLSLAVSILLTVCFSMAVAVYFVDRIDSVLSQSGIILTDSNYSDLIHLQIQFVIGILSLMTLVIIFLILNRKYTTYMNIEAKIDSLTGIMTRKAFFQACEKELSAVLPEKEISGYFIMFDVDYFKQINDRYGHPAGDRILKTVAQELQKIFGEDGLAGRVGGDEFAVLLYLPISREALEAKLQLFLNRIHKIESDERRLSCSIGAVSVTVSKMAEDYYLAADRLLYMAKKQGRDRYVVGSSEEAEVQ